MIYRGRTDDARKIVLRGRSGHFWRASAPVTALRLRSGSQSTTRGSRNRPRTHDEATKVTRAQDTRSSALLSSIPEAALRRIARPL